MEVQNVRMSQIKLGNNSRLDVTDEEIAGLMESIREEGLLQPIGVAKGTRGKYQIVYGNRRFLAYSKLGKKTIPAIEIKNNKQSDIDIKNLVENVQRKNVSINEVGRYIEHLTEADGLTLKEIAVRMGVSQTYVEQCLQAFREVPKEFRKDIEPKTAKGPVRKGKIALASVKAIERVVKNYKLNSTQKKKLYAAAKLPKFAPTNLESYAETVSSKPTITPKAIIEKSKVAYKLVQLSMKIDENTYSRLHKKYVENGPFSSMQELMRARLSGKISEAIKVKE